MKALLIDDERLARSELRRLLGAFAEVEIAGEAANAKQARQQIETLQPDLLFLDVQMPGETGMELLESLEPPVPEVIFTTAYDEFAVKAFDLNALDYLLKPVDPARLAAAIEKLRVKRAALALAGEAASARAGRMAVVGVGNGGGHAKSSPLRDAAGCRYLPDCNQTWERSQPPFARKSRRMTSRRLVGCVTSWNPAARKGPTAPTLISSQITFLPSLSIG